MCDTFSMLLLSGVGLNLSEEIFFFNLFGMNVFINVAKKSLFHVFDSADGENFKVKFIFYSLFFIHSFIFFFNESVFFFLS